MNERIDKIKKLLAMKGKVEWEGNLDEMRTDAKAALVVKRIRRKKV